MTFQAKLHRHCFQSHTATVLSLNCKIIELKTLNLVIHLSLISNKASNLFSATCSEINAVSSTHLILP